MGLNSLRLLTLYSCSIINLFSNGYIKFEVNIGGVNVRKEKKDTNSKDEYKSKNDIYIQKYLLCSILKNTNFTYKTTFVI